MNTNTKVGRPTIGELLSKLRRDVGMDQDEIAVRLGIARNTVSNYERGRSMPPLDVVYGWSRITGVSIEWIVREAWERPDPEMLDYTNPDYETGRARRDSNPQPSDP